MTDAGAKIDTAVDAICVLGCEVVNDYIGALRNGESRPEYRQLDPVQRAQLLQQLEVIMAVYRAR